MNEITKEECIGCKRKIETKDPIWDKDYSQWKWTDLGMICQNCYPIHKNLLKLFKKKVRKYFTESREDLTCRFDDKLNGMM